MREKRDCRRDPAFAKLQHPTGNAAQDQEGGDYKKKLNYKIEIIITINKKCDADYVTLFRVGVIFNEVTIFSFCVFFRSFRGS